MVKTAVDAACVFPLFGKLAESVCHFSVLGSILGFTFGPFGATMARMTSIRLLKHEAVPDCGSFEVRFSDRRPSRFFYWDDESSRRMRPDQMTSEQALEQAKAFARSERDR